MLKDYLNNIALSANADLSHSVSINLTPNFPSYKDGVRRLEINKENFYFTEYKVYLDLIFLQNNNLLDLQMDLFNDFIDSVKFYIVSNDSNINSSMLINYFLNSNRFIDIYFNIDMSNHRLKFTYNNDENDVVLLSLDEIINWQESGIKFKLNSYGVSLSYDYYSDLYDDFPFYFLDSNHLTSKHGIIDINLELYASNENIFYNYLSVLDKLFENYSKNKYKDVKVSIDLIPMFSYSSSVFSKVLSDLEQKYSSYFNSLTFDLS